MSKWKAVNTNQGWMIKRTDKPGYVASTFSEEHVNLLLGALALHELMINPAFLEHLALQLYGGIHDQCWATDGDALVWLKEKLASLTPYQIKEG